MVQTRIAQANGRLKVANVGIRIETKGDRLYLRGTFPPRLGAQRVKPYQQRLALGYHANPSGVKLAEQQAKIIGTLLEQGKFDWTPYQKQQRLEVQTCTEWVERLEADYFAKGGTETTWKGDYLKILKRLPNEPISAELLQAVIDDTVANTKTRKRACMAIGALARFADIDYAPASLSGNYGPRQVTPRDLPDDRSIAQWFHQLKNPAWRWVYGMMATYGLRNHEVFHLDLERLQGGDRVVSVYDTTKTGKRQVWAFYPEWFDEFSLSDVQLPAINLDRPNERIGNSVTDYFRDTAKLPTVPYNLRHCWAVRTLEFGLPVELAAKQMGHSVEVHTTTYHHWITESHHQRVYEVLMMRGDRPTAPAITVDQFQSLSTRQSTGSSP